MQKELTELLERAECELACIKIDQTQLIDDRNKTLKKIYGKKYYEPDHFSVRGVMNEIFGHILIEKEFETYYPIYVLGFTTGRLLGFSGREYPLKHDINNLKNTIKNLENPGVKP
jgi:hypothetical protein